MGSLCISTTTQANTQQQPQPPPIADPFTQSLQEKTEQQLLELLQRNKPTGKEEALLEEDVDDELKADTETGEVGGFSGKEPTRFGDWEHKGRCTDFS